MCVTFALCWQTKSDAQQNAKENCYIKVGLNKEMETIM
jgi:hypothetical protein